MLMIAKLPKTVREANKHKFLCVVEEMGDAGTEGPAGPILRRVVALNVCN